jgi:uncharacterized damage-inducible protein DinB
MNEHVVYIFQRNIWGIERDRKGSLFYLIAELIHHKGQIAMLRDT